MAVFRKDHVKVVKWMVKVTRFPSDQEKKKQDKKQEKRRADSDDLDNDSQV